MAHQPGWTDLYSLLENLLEEGRSPPSDLVAQCKASRTGIGETMLHWYAIEGAPEVLRELIRLGFEVNVKNDFGQTPIMESALIGRWDNARVLLEHGADLSITDADGLDFFAFLDERRVHDRPEWARHHA
jgi:ankyrin repeat protein